MIGIRKERVDFEDLANEFSEEQQQLGAPWRMATGNGENGSIKLALWKLDFNNRNCTQNIYPEQIPPAGYGLHAYRQGFKNPISARVVQIDPEDPRSKEIRHSLEYLALRSNRTITSAPIISGPADHHRKNDTLVEIFELRRNSLLDKVRQRFNRSNTKEKNY